MVLLVRGAIAWLVFSAGFAVLGSGRAEAEPGGCVTTAPVAVENRTSAMTCTWVATGKAGAYLASTANPWQITVSQRMRGKWKVVQTVQGGGAQATPPAGTLSLERGHRVRAEIFDVCASAPIPYYSYSSCAAAGFLAVGNT